MYSSFYKVTFVTEFKFRKWKIRVTVTKEVTDRITNKDRQVAHKVSLPQIKADMVMLVTVEVKAAVMAAATLAKSESSVTYLIDFNFLSVQENDQQIKGHPVNNKMERSHSKSDGEV